MFLHAHMPSLIPHPDRCVEKVQVVDKKAMASTFRSEVASQSRLFMSHLVLNLLQLRFFFASFEVGKKPLLRMAEVVVAES